MTKFVVLSAIAALGGLGCAAANQGLGQDKQLTQYSYDVSDTCYYTSECYTVQVGSGDVDSSRLKPYRAMWTQDVPQDGVWVRGATTFEEKLSVDEEGNWKHVQTVRQPDGSATIGTRILERDTLQVLNNTLELKGMAPEQPEKVIYDLAGDSFAADVYFSDGRKVQGQSRDLAMPMFDGQIGGLTLAALPLRTGYVATLPMVIPNLGIYWIEASVVGKSYIPTADGSQVEVWEVNANWFNLTDGDIYEPGRDGDGGVYYIAVNPGEGIPHVVEYANNGAIISWDGIRRY